MENRRDALRRIGVAVIAAAPLLLVACTSSPAPEPEAAPRGEAALVTYSGCDELLTYFQENARERVTAWGLGTPRVLPLDGEFSAGDAEDAAEQSATRATDSGNSATNNQVEGVDEADIVKNNGEIIAAVINGQVRIIDAIGAEALATVELAGRTSPTELLLDGSMLVVLGGPAHDAYGAEYGDPVDGYGYAGYPERTTLTQVDLSDPREPRVLQTTRLEGSYRSARLIGSTIRLAMVSDPPGLAWVQPEGDSLAAEDEALAANRALIDASTITDWLPNLSVDDGTSEPLLGCGAVGVPEEFSGFTTVSVLTLEIDGGTAPTSAAGVLGTGATVYASAERLIVASTPWDVWLRGSGESTTDLHVFDIATPEATTYVGSGRVDGWLLNQFAIDEADGVIRVATTVDPSAEESSSSLVILAEGAEGLVETGRVDDLGVGEQIYAVRYLSADLAAVVTFRQIDPLYLIDTRDPSAPRQVGELKIPGYSTYLHPLDDGRLLGIGQSATDDGRTTGLQASLFDVSDPSDPQQVSTLTWADHYSTAESDHRAFLIWQDRVYLAVEEWTAEAAQEVLTVDVGAAALSEGPVVDIGAGLPANSYAGVQRVLIVGDRVWAIGWSTALRFEVGNRSVGTVLTY